MAVEKAMLFLMILGNLCCDQFHPFEGSQASESGNSLAEKGLKGCFNYPI
jgi:hypothetical protein